MPEPEVGRAWDLQGVFKESTQKHQGKYCIPENFGFEKKNKKKNKKKKCPEAPHKLFQSGRDSVHHGSLLLIWSVSNPSYAVYSDLSIENK